MGKPHEGPGHLDETVVLGKKAGPQPAGIETLGAEQQEALFRSLTSTYAGLVNSESFRQEHPQPTMGDFVEILEKNIALLREAGPGASVADVFQTLDASIQEFFEHSVTRPVADLVKEMETHLEVLKTVDPSTKIIDVIVVVDQNTKKPESKE